MIATKVGKLPGLTRPAARRRSARRAEDSLRRLGIDRIDLYYAHFDDTETPLEETLGAFGELIDAGKVRAIAASNYSGARLTEALEIAEREGLPRYVALQPHYNLVERDYEADQRPVCEREDIACFPFYALANGFLTGKYRPGGEDVDSARAEGAQGLPGRARREDAGRARRDRRGPRHRGRRRRPRLARGTAHGRWRRSPAPAPPSSSSR